MTDCPQTRSEYPDCPPPAPASWPDPSGGQTDDCERGCRSQNQPALGGGHPGSVEYWAWLGGNQVIAGMKPFVTNLQFRPGFGPIATDAARV